MQENSYSKNFEWLISTLVLALIIIGIFNIYSAEYSDGQEKVIDFSSSVGKQIIWFGISILMFIIILILDIRFFINFSYPIYAFTLLLLLATLIIGKEVAGSKSWIIFGGFSLQPSELAKFGTVLALARFIDTTDINVAKFKHFAIAFLIIGLPMGLIVLQNDFGSAIVFASLFLVLYRQGLPSLFLFTPILFAILFVLVLLVNFLFIIGVLVLVAIIFIYFTTNRLRAVFISLAAIVIVSAFMFSVDHIFEKVLQPHQQSRINVLLHKEVDLQGSGYNVHQSLIAIGSGGVTGKGFLNGTQTKFNFIPEQKTDFIFCTIGEEYGFFGSVGLLVLFIGLILRILYISEKQKFRYTRIFGYGVLSIIFLHFAVNIGMTLGLFPVIGIPLPFISYGGSSLLGFTLMIGVFLKLELEYRHYFN
ncbi:MAG: rod shape-determining protein RodA [Bacteroidetes bacterium]|jgi:rod shape determining protein RodA|nr:rod shape-determining protein RodA [Bacteroidota bacterium]MBT7041617.1 rod shape-determining protein RodA [Bacteroidota bacterium]MBT7994479.1 rod shape-determining protein RodA [Bacteroidota bacterium]